MLNRRSLAVSAFFVSSLLPLQAHDPGLSSLSLRVHEGELDALLMFAPADVEALVPMDLDQDGQITSAEFTQARPSLELSSREALEVRIDGEIVEAAEASVQRVEEVNSDNVEIRLTFPRPDGKLLRVRSPWIPAMPRGHRQYFTFRDGNGALVDDGLLAAQDDAFETTLSPAASARGSFLGFVALGVEHIVTGYDHLLFLLGLLVAGTGFGSAVKVITSFTVAHSITLALATWGAVPLRTSLVEPLIALSIVYVGIENLFRPASDRRWVLTFIFGLVHGMGFASVLRDIGVGSGEMGVTAPLLGFNLGVEAGQIAIAMAVLPVLWHMGRHRFFSVRFVPGASAAVAFAGLYWLVERTTEWMG